MIEHAREALRSGERDLPTAEDGLRKRDREADFEEDEMTLGQHPGTDTSRSLSRQSMRSLAGDSASGSGLGIDTTDSEAFAEGAVDAMLLHEGRRPSRWTATGGLHTRGLLRVPLQLCQSIVHMRKAALVRAIFNYPEPGQKLRETAWLDGLRGLAAFEVFIFHYNDGWIDRTLAWGTGPKSDPSWYYAPLIRTVWTSGDAAVCLFFAISGYALSLKMLQQMRNGQLEQLLTSLSSSIFRRAIRLYMPVLVMTFVFMILCRLGLPTPIPYDLAPTFLWEIWSWLQSFAWLLLPLSHGYHWERRVNKYDGGISWTIPMEYHGSLQVYMAILFLCRVRSIMVRRALIFAWVVKSVVRDDWPTAQFLVGMTFAEHDLQRAASQNHQDLIISDAEKATADTNRRRRRLRKVIFTFLFAFGFFLSGLPGAYWVNEYEGDRRIQSRPFYDWITAPLAAIDLYTEQDADRYLLCLASMCCFIAIGEIKTLKRVVQTRPVQYLGRISFGLYLCHIFMRNCLTPVKIFTLGVMGIDAELQSDASKPRLFAAYIMLMIPAAMLNFIVAGLFERLVDKPSVKAGKLFETWCLSRGRKSTTDERVLITLREINGQS